MASAATAECSGVLPELSCAFGSLSGASSSRFALSAREYRAAKCNGVSPDNKLIHQLMNELATKKPRKVAQSTVTIIYPNKSVMGVVRWVPGVLEPQYENLKSFKPA